MQNLEEKEIKESSLVGSLYSTTGYTATVKKPS